MSLLFKSIYLDVEFFKLPLSLLDKVTFLMKKYWLLLKNYSIGFTKGRSSVKICGGQYFFEDKFGVAFLQSVYVDNAFLKNFIHPNGIVVDIGANIGQFNFFSRHFLAARRVYSFEPIKEAFNILKLNVKEDIYNFAISCNSALDLYFTDTSLTASAFGKDKESKVESVKCVKLDNLEELENESYIDLLKIDTEGSEYDVIEASGKILQKSKFILVETSIERESSGGLIDTVILLKTFLPKVKLIKIGRVYLNEQKSVTEAVDLLFVNKGL